MADFNNTYAAGLKHGQIRDSAGVIYDIDAIVSVDASPEQDDTEIKGDDSIKAVFSSNRKETLTIEARGLSLDVIQAITGNSVSSSATGAEIAVGTVSELAPPYVEVKASTNARTKAGVACTISKTFHKVQLNKVNTKMAGETEFSLTMEGISVQTAEDITGADLASSRTATISVTEGLTE